MHDYKNKFKFRWHNYNSNFNIGKIIFFLNKYFLKYARLLKKKISVVAVAVVILTTVSRLRLSKNMRLYCGCGYSIHHFSWFLLLELLGLLEKLKNRQCLKYVQCFKTYAHFLLEFFGLTKVWFEVLLWVLFFGKKNRLFFC